MLIEGHGMLKIGLKSESDDYYGKGKCQKWKEKREGTEREKMPTHRCLVWQTQGQEKVAFLKVLRDEG